jgi:hypothetical protein
MAWQDQAGPGMARRGVAGPGRTRRRRGLAGHGKAPPHMAPLDGAGQGTARARLGAAWLPSQRGLNQADRGTARQGSPLGLAPRG